MVETWDNDMIKLDITQLLQQRCIPFIFHKCTCGILVLSPFISFFFSSPPVGVCIFFVFMNSTITSWKWLMSEVSDHLAMAFFCPSCKRTLRLNRQGIAEHRRECVGEAPGGPPPWRCEKCNFTLPGETWMIFGWGNLFDSCGFSPHDFWLGNGCSTS